MLRTCEVAAFPCGAVVFPRSMEPPPSLILQLFTSICPKTCENFLALCRGDKGQNKDGVTLCYKGSPLHRVVSGGWLQGGDIVSGAGDSGGFGTRRGMPT